MYNLVVGLALGGLFFNMLSVLIRLISKKFREDLAEIFLAITLFGLMWFIFIYLMVITQYIQYIPNLYNKGIPIYYLTAPCLYFYVRFKLYPSQVLPRYWFLHLIPFLFGLIDIIPYMLTGPEEKQAFMVLLTQNASLGFKHEYGFVNQQWHYVLKLSLAIIYLMAQWRLLFMADATAYPYPPRLRFTLYFYTLFFSLFTLLRLGIVLNILFNRPQAMYILKDVDQLFWPSGLYLLFGMWLFLTSIKYVYKQKQI